MTNEYELGVYYFPEYHPDPRNDEWRGEGWTEWELVRRAESRFPGHDQPKVPAWGYEDESDPEVMAKKIEAASDHGVSAFIFDWYWYEDGPFLQSALEDGFLQANNVDELDFALMWANHDWKNIHPAKRSESVDVLAEGAVSREAFERATDRVVDTYFEHPSYWTVDGEPYFSVYEIQTLVDGLGGVEPARDALDSFREKARDSGFPGLHLNAVVGNQPILPDEDILSDPNKLLDALGFDSTTSYVWIHHVPLESFPTVPYEDIRERAVDDWPEFANDYTLPYYPNVTVGWDASPRTVQSDAFDDTGYPFMTTLSDNTPKAFRTALEEAREFMDRNDVDILTVNAWNEWTEGSYLEPDEEHGMAYLEAIDDVFGE